MAVSVSRNQLPDTLVLVDASTRTVGGVGVARELLSSVTVALSVVFSDVLSDLAVEGTRIPSEISLVL